MRQRDTATRFRESVWGPTSTRLRQSSRLREPAIAAYRFAARALLTGPPPKVLANSVPKAGAHLLTQLLSGLPSFWYSGIHLKTLDFCADAHEPGDRLGEFDPVAFGRRLARVRNGQFVTAHLGARQGVTDTLERQGFAHLLIVRDPRDVVVSTAFYLTKNTRLYMQPWFAELPDNDARFMAAITGLPSRDGYRAVPSMGARLEQFRPWLTDPSVCLLRFEELVGRLGGGSDEMQRDSIRRVLQTCHRNQDEGTLDRLCATVFAEHSATFRRGVIGDWRNHLTQEHLDALDEIAPGAVAAFGYA